MQEEILRADVVLLLAIEVAQIVQQARIPRAVGLLDLFQDGQRTAFNRRGRLEISRIRTEIRLRRQTDREPGMVRSQRPLDHLGRLPE